MSKKDIPELILASASPRRRQLLAEAGIAYKNFPVDIYENIDSAEKPEAACQRLASEKALAAAPAFPDKIVLGADTLISLNDCIIGKPRSEDDARRLLARLSDNTHRVLTGVCLYQADSGLKSVWYAETKVTFRKLSQSDIEDYVKNVDVMDKAGAYAAQEGGAVVIKKIEGLRSNVIGLPIEEVVEKLSFQF